MTTRREFTITRLAVSDGIVTAFVSVVGGSTFPVERRGGWIAHVRPYPRARRTVARCVLPEVAAELQKRARRFEQSVPCPRCGAGRHAGCKGTAGVAHRERLDVIEHARSAA